MDLPEDPDKYVKTWFYVVVVFVLLFAVASIVATNFY
jgi:hypothetical protein